MITISDTITIAIVTISPGPNTHTYTHTLWEASSRFHRKIWVGDLLSPGSNCRPFMPNLGLQLSTPWPWGIVTSHRSRCAKDIVQTMISTDAMILSNICHQPPTTHYPPPASRLLVPGACSSASLWTEHTGAYMGAYSQVRLGVSCLWRFNLGA